MLEARNQPSHCSAFRHGVGVELLVLSDCYFVSIDTIFLDPFRALTSSALSYFTDFVIQKLSLV
jgi:hypothetical protein